MRLVQGSPSPPPGLALVWPGLAWFGFGSSCVWYKEFQHSRLVWPWFGLVWLLALVHLVQGSPTLPPGLAWFGFWCSCVWYKGVHDSRLVWPGLAPGPSVFGTRKSITPAWFGLVWPLALVHLVQGRPSLPPGLACLGLACVCGCMRVYRRHHAASHWRSESPPLRI